MPYRCEHYFETYIISDRTDDLQNKTIENLKNHGFPLEKIHVYFKQPLESMHVYKRNILREITAKYPSGIAIVTHSKDAQLFGLYEYTVLGFDSIKDESEFANTEFVCQNWDQIRSSLEEQ